MATLTATGVNTSNGTLDGFYTGTASANTSFPIGSYLNRYGDSCSSYLANSTYPVWTTGVDTTTYYYVGTGSSSAQLAGTWRARGTVYNTNLMQRVA